MAYRIQSIDRCFLILDALSRQDSAATLNVLHRQTNLPVPTLFRFLHVLADKGYVRRRDDGTYEIGYRLLGLVPHSRRIALLKSLGQPVIARLAYRTGAAAHLGMLDGNQVVCIASKNFGPHRACPEEGVRLDAHASALGKALLAFTPRLDVCLRYENAPLRSHTPATVTTVAGLMRQLEAVRKSLLAYDEGESFAGIRSVASPVLDQQGRAVCAVSVSRVRGAGDPESGLRPDDAVVQAAAELARLFGC